VHSAGDNVGGPQLVKAWSLLARGGSLQSIGWTSGEPAVLQPYATVGPVKTLSSYLTLDDAGADLGTLDQSPGRLARVLGADCGRDRRDARASGERQGGP